MALIFLLAWTPGAAMAASESKVEALIPSWHAEVLAAVEKSLPAVAELTLEDAEDLTVWLSANAEGGRFSVAQVGCWNKKNGIVPVQLALDCGGAKEVRRWFKVKVNGKERVLLAKRDLVRGEPVQSSDFISSLVNCQDLSQEAAASVEEGMIYQLTANLRAGTPLFSRWLQPFCLIKRGELVQVFLEQEGVRINTRGVAMGNGSLKEVITIKNPTTRKFYQAQVTGSGEVTVVY
ncbi:MAG: flagellar basal body P-ring formation protein FlgA [Deltaproteobacteria bacterium]|nr:flagellar basal body P-ring formation protein FlgA [Deltaproteobacteria bacterium]